jgi:hypothetical protein
VGINGILGINGIVGINGILGIVRGGFADLQIENPRAGLWTPPRNPAPRTRRRPDVAMRLDTELEHAE